MDWTIARHAPSAVPDLLAELDAEFVYRRGRRLSLTLRYPQVLGTATGADLWCLEGETVPIETCCVVRDFAWQIAGAFFRGAMIGMVWTRPAARGRGLASRLLEDVVRRLRERGLDFAVLWSGIPAFYERLGWIRSDRGTLGRIAGVARPALPLTAATAPDFSALERLRERCLTARVSRGPAAFATLPLPAERMHWLVAGPRDDPRAYLALGETGDARYVYEMIGDPACYPALWARAVNGTTTIYVNDELDSPSACWLSREREVSWEHQQLTLWRALAREFPAAAPSSWHIPYLDRI